MVRLLSLNTVVFAAMAASPALACETEPSLVRLPGETAEALETRLDKTHEDQWVIRRYWRESSDYEHAPIVYIARVLVSDRSPTAPGGALIFPRAVVQPIYPIKGRLPTASKTLVQTNLSSCGAYGDGDAASAPVGEIVFVFEGLTKLAQRPNGIDSIRAADARTFELLDPLYQFGSAHPF